MDARKSDSSDVCTIAPPERRREWRKSRGVAVEISGFDARGRFFTERTSTLDVNDSGCSFLLNAEVEKNSPISVRMIHRREGLMPGDSPVLFRVVNARQTYPGWPKWTVAGEKLQPIQLWTAGFPAESDDPAVDSPDSLDGEPPAA